MKPIVTLTLNPTIDFTAEADRVRPINKVRTSNERYDPGGGGINGARVVETLGGETLALYCAGGITGVVLDDLLDRAGVPRRRLDIAGNTRISHVVFEHESGTEYRFVPEGPKLSDEEWGRALAALDEVDADYVIVSGSLPRGVPQDFCTRAGERIRRGGAKFVLDTSGAALKAAFAAGGIWLAKPSRGEFESLVGRKLPEREEVAVAALDIVRSGAVELLAVTLGRDGAVLASASGARYLKGPEIETKSAVGAGDSFLAAMTLALSRGEPHERAFAFGVAAGAAAALTPGTELCRRKDVERLFEQVLAELEQRAA